MTVTLKNGALTARIESKGAELLSLVKNETEYMWQKDPAFWGKTSPVLFPMPVDRCLLLWYARYITVVNFYQEAEPWSIFGYRTENGS